MKKILAFVVAAMLVMAMSVTAFAAAEIELGTLDNVSTELEVLPFDTVLNTGDKVVLHFTGTTTGAFRYWLSAGTWTACSEQVTVEDTEFDILVEIEVTADGANEVQFKGPSYGVPLDGLNITYCGIFYGTMDEYNASADAPADEVVEETTEEVVEETTTEEAPAVEEEPKAEAPATGLALAVVPMIVAAVAVVASKRR